MLARQRDLTQSALAACRANEAFTQGGVQDRVVLTLEKFKRPQCVNDPITIASKYLTKEYFNVPFVTDIVVCSNDRVCSNANQATSSQKPNQTFITSIAGTLDFFQACRIASKIDNIKSDDQTNLGKR